jgi:hypothetical protein
MDSTEPLFRSHVDHPTVRALAAGSTTIRGWCFHVGGARITAVRARLGGTVHEGTHGVARPDVEATLGVPGTARSGYEIPVEVTGRKGGCRLEAQLEDGSWRLFEELRFTPPSRLDLAWLRARGWIDLPGLFERRDVRSRLRWTRFWLKSFRGDPSAWALLSAAEEEEVHAWAGRHNWLNIVCWRQHPPRPVRLERLPRPFARRLPAVAMVTPSFNQAEFIAETMRSVLAQEGVELDYQVQDGASTDGSVAVIEDVARAHHGGPRLRWESAPDAGQAEAIVKAFARTTGAPDDVMGYLNSDDLLMPGALRFVAGYFARHPEIDVLYGHRVLIDAAGRETGRWFMPRMECDDLRLFDLVPQETLFWRRRLWDRVGGIDCSFQFALDWDLILRFRAAGARFARLPWLLGMFRHHPRQKSQAWLESVGVPEMNRLHLRTLGRPATDEELRVGVRRACFDGGIVQALFERGIRV